MARLRRVERLPVIREASCDPDRTPREVYIVPFQGEGLSDSQTCASEKHHSHTRRRRNRRPTSDSRPSRAPAWGAPRPRDGAVVSAAPGAARRATGDTRDRAPSGARRGRGRCGCAGTIARVLPGQLAHPPDDGRVDRRLRLRVMERRPRRSEQRARGALGEPAC